MTIEATCVCGYKNAAPDEWAGRPATCPSCGKIFRVPERASLTKPKLRPRMPVESRPVPARSRSTSITVVIVLAILGAIGSYSLNTRKSSEYTPTKHETAQERGRAASEGFKPPAVEPVAPGPDEAKVRKTIEALTAAHARGDGEGFAKLIHIRRLLAEVESSGVIPQIRTVSQEDAFVRGAERGLAQSIRSQSGSPLQWNSVQVVRVRFLPGRPEAEAFAWVRLGMVRTKFRFWLLKEAAAWKVFDFEAIEDGMRASTSIASVAGSGFDPAGLAKIRQASQAVQQAVALIATDPEKAIDALRRARAGGAPGVLLNQIEIMEAAILHGLGRNDEAMALYDGALRRRKDLPMAHHGRGQIFSALGKHEEAIRAEEEYLALTGDDGDALATIGQALEALKKPDEAMAAYRRGAAADDEDWSCRSHLARLLVGQKKVKEAVPFYLEACRLAPAEESLFAEAAGVLKNAEAWEALLELSRAEAKRGGLLAEYYEGVSLRRLGKLIEAEQALRAGLAKADKTGKDDYREELIYTLAARGRHDEAMAIVEAMEKEAPGRVVARYHRAYVQASAKKTAEAIDGLRSLLKEFPGWHETVAKEPVFEGLLKDKGLAESLAAAKEKSDYDDAVEESEDPDEIATLSKKRIERAPDDPDAWYHLGRSLRMLKKFQAAEAALRSAVEKSPAAGRTLATLELSRALAELGRADEALSLIEKVAADPDRKPMALSARAEVLAIAKRDPESARAVVELLEAKPHYVASIEANEVFDSVRKRPEVQQALKKAKAAQKE